MEDFVAKVEEFLALCAPATRKDHGKPGRLRGTNGVTIKSLTLEAAHRTRKIWRDLVRKHPGELCPEWLSPELPIAELRGSKRPGRNGRYMTQVYRDFAFDIGYCPPASRLYRICEGAPYQPGNCIWLRNEEWRAFETIVPMNEELAAQAHYLLLKNWSVSVIAYFLHVPRQAVHDLKRGKTFRRARTAAVRLLEPDLFG